MRGIPESIIQLSNKNPRANKFNKLHDIKLKKITIQHPSGEKGRTLEIITNALHLSADEIAQLYKKRWEIELLFKFIKQNLRFKKFIGENKNAIKIQLITAMIAYILLLLFKLRNIIKISWSKLVLSVKQFLSNSGIVMQPPLLE